MKLDNEKLLLARSDDADVHILANALNEMKREMKKRHCSPQALDSKTEKPALLARSIRTDTFFQSRGKTICSLPNLRYDCDINDWLWLLPADPVSRILRMMMTVACPLR